MKKCVLLMAMVAFVLNVHSQNNSTYYPKVGEILPDHQFDDLVNYQKKSFKISDLRGKWFVLDYWSEGCAGCVASFPKMDKLANDFRGKAEIFMVGAFNNNRQRIKRLFEGYLKRYGYTLPCAFDSISPRKYALSAVPSIFVVNPEGKIVAKTISLDSLALSQLIEGKSPRLQKMNSVEEVEEVKNYSDCVSTSTFYGSVLTHWNDKMPINAVLGFSEGSYSLAPTFPKNIARIHAADLNEMFMIAYFGQTIFFNRDSLYGLYGNSTQFEVKDSLIKHISGGMTMDSLNTYEYSLRMPIEKANPRLARKLLLDDLHRYFNYTSKIIPKEIEVYELVISNEEKFNKSKSKGYESLSKKVVKNNKISMLKDSVGYEYLKDEISYRLYNLSINQLIRGKTIHTALASKYGFDSPLVPPIFNATGYNGRINFELLGDHRDYNVVIEALEKHGLSLIKSRRVLPCIVVTDKEVNNDK